MCFFSRGDFPSFHLYWLRPVLEFVCVLAWLVDGEGRSVGVAGQRSGQGSAGWTQRTCRGQIGLQGHVTAGALPGVTWVLTKI